MDATSFEVPDDSLTGMFFDAVTSELIPKIARQEVIVVLLPESGVPDAKIAVEFGAAVLLNKPIIAVAAPGAEVPPRVSRAVDAVVVGDWRNKPKELPDLLIAAMDGLTERGVL